MIRSEELKNYALRIFILPVIKFIIGDIEDFERTGDKEYIDESKKSLNRLIESQNLNDDFIKMLKYIVKTSDNLEDLTNNDKKFNQSF